MLENFKEYSSKKIFAKSQKAKIQVIIKHYACNYGCFNSSNFCFFKIVGIEYFLNGGNA